MVLTVARVSEVMRWSETGSKMRTTPSAGAVFDHLLS